MLRGLFRLFLALLLAGAVLWVALPVAASVVAGAAVGAAGLHGERVEVSVIADPPLKLLLFEADRVQVRATNGTWRGVVFAKLDLTISGLRAGASNGVLDGAFSGVELPDGSGGSLRARTIRVSGPVSAADLTVALGGDDIVAAVRQALAGEPVDLARVSLEPPDAVRIGTPAGDILARLAVGTDGSLGLIVTVPGTAGRTITILQPGPSLPIHFGAVAVSGDSVELRGVVDTRTIGL